MQLLDDDGSRILYDKNTANKVADELFSESELSDEPLTPQQILDTMKSLPFWCGDSHKHETNPEYYWKDFCCTTHIAGLPRHPATKKEMPPTPYQLEFVNEVIRLVTRPEGYTQEGWDRLAHKFHISKGRQMGFTEIVLRLIFHFTFSRYAGSNVGIMAATNGGLARKDLRRYYRLFSHIKQAVTQEIKVTKEGTCMKIANDTIVWAFAASEEAITGDTKYACIYMDESAKWKLVDDTPVFNSIIPIVETNGSDLFLVSTFKGPIKMFYKISQDPQDYVLLQYDIWRTEGNLYTTAQIKKMLNSKDVDPDQEYLCKATIGEDSILGAITNDDRATFDEWGTEDEDEEDDGYIEEDNDTENDWP